MHNGTFKTAIWYFIGSLEEVIAKGPESYTTGEIVENFKTYKHFFR